MIKSGLTLDQSSGTTLGGYKLTNIWCVILQRFYLVYTCCAFNAGWVLFVLPPKTGLGRWGCNPTAGRPARMYYRSCVVRAMKVGSGVRLVGGVQNASILFA